MTWKKTRVSVLLPDPSCPPRPQPRKRSSGEEMGENRGEMAVWQLHPGRCGREEGGAQPRPLVTRCHLLLPRRRLAQTMAARWRGGPDQPQSLASADTYCPRPTLRLPNPRALYGAIPLPGPSTTCSTSPLVICRAPHFSVHDAGGTSCVSCLPPCPSSNFRACLSMYRTIWTTEWAVCGAAGTPILPPCGKCLIPRALISDAVR